MSVETFVTRCRFCSRSDPHTHETCARCKRPGSVLLDGRLLCGEHALERASLTAILGGVPRDLDEVAAVESAGACLRGNHQPVQIVSSLGALVWECSFCGESLYEVPA
jgi:hypothetical protein